MSVYGRVPCLPEYPHPGLSITINHQRACNLSNELVSTAHAAVIVSGDAIDLEMSSPVPKSISTIQGKEIPPG